MCISDKPRPPQQIQPVKTVNWDRSETLLESVVLASCSQTYHVPRKVLLTYCVVLVKFVGHTVVIPDVICIWQCQYVIKKNFLFLFLNLSQQDEKKSIMMSCHPSDCSVQISCVKNKPKKVDGSLFSHSYCGVDWHLTSRCSGDRGHQSPHGQVSEVSQWTGLCWQNVK